MTLGYVMRAKADTNILEEVVSKTSKLRKSSNKGRYCYGKDNQHKLGSKCSYLEHKYSTQPVINY